MIRCQAAFLLCLLAAASLETADTRRINPRPRSKQARAWWRLQRELGTDKDRPNGKTNQAEEFVRSKEKEEEEAKTKLQPKGKVAKQSVGITAVKHMQTLEDRPLTNKALEAVLAADDTALLVPLKPGANRAWFQSIIEAKNRNYKGALEAWVRRVAGEPSSKGDIVYTVTSREQGDFEATVKIPAIDGMEFRTAPRPSRRGAQQRAAQLALLSYEAKYPRRAQQALKQRRDTKSALKLEAKCNNAVALRKSLRSNLSEARNDRPITILSLNVETWEKGFDKLTEIGIAIAHLSFVDTSQIQKLESRIRFRHRHLLIREHLAMYNGDTMADNKDYFIFGDSEVLSFVDAVQQLIVELSSADFVVGHALGAAGLAWLHQTPQSQVVDIQTLAFAIPGVTLSRQPQLALGPMADAFGLNPDRLYNAANDASFTLQVMLSQCGVVFRLPLRMMSKHQSMPEFQNALAEAAMHPSILANNTSAGNSAPFSSVPPHHPDGLHNAATYSGNSEQGRAGAMH